MQFSKVILALLSFGTVAIAAPAEAAAASPAAVASPAAPNDYCDKFRGREQDDCRNYRDQGFCERFNNRDGVRQECFDRRPRGGGGPSNDNGNVQCTEYRRNELPQRCIRDCERADRDGFRRPNWC